MTSNLLIGRPYVGLNATSITGSISADSSYPFTNAVIGSRAERVKFGSAATQPTITFDLGASLTSAVDFLFIGRADLLKQKGANNIFIRSSSDNSAYTTRLGTTSALSTRTFSGPRSEDLIFTSAFNDDTSGVSASAFRYWRLQVGNSGSSKIWEFGKAIFGPWFDMGRDPSFVRPIYRDKETNGERRAGVNLSLTWNGVTDAVRNNFISQIYKYRDVMPIVLYTTTYHDILNEHRTLFGRIKQAKFEYICVGYHKITVDFEELI
jgi:hypothetical protein